MNAVYNVVFALFDKRDESVYASLVTPIVKSLTSASAHPLLQLKLLNTLFNSAPTSAKFDIFVAIVEFALKTNNSRSLRGQFTNLEAWIKVWDISPIQVTQLYMLAIRCAESDNNTEAKTRFVLSYLKALDSVDEKTLKDNKNFAAEAALVAIGSSTISDCDTLLGFKAVAQLKDDETFKNTYSLLSILAYGDVSEYLTFYEANKTSVSNHEQVLKKMHVLSLCTAGDKKQILTYSEIATLLHVSADDVEESVINAVMTGLLDAKLDQDKEVVYIRRTTARSFKEGGWERLGQKLTTWKTNIRDVVSVLLQIRDNGSAAVEEAVEEQEQA